jgi:hypothetical protein
VVDKQAALKAAEVNLAYTNIVSPVVGTVITRSIDVGQTVAASLQTPTLFLIGKDLTKMQVDTNVSEADVGDLRVGQAAYFTVQAFPGRSFRGRVWQIRRGPITVQNVVTYDVVVAFDNPQRLLFPGMTADTHIVTDEHDNVLRVPLPAIRFTPEGLGHAAGGRRGAAGAAESAGSPPGAGRPETGESGAGAPGGENPAASSPPSPPSPLSSTPAPSTSTSAAGAGAAAAPAGAAPGGGGAAGGETAPPGGHRSWRRHGDSPAGAAGPGQGQDQSAPEAGRRERGQGERGDGQREHRQGRHGAAAGAGEGEGGQGAAGGAAGRAGGERRHDGQRAAGRAGAAARHAARVWVLNADGTLHPVQVTTGLDDGTLIEVSGPGLRAGDRVVVNEIVPEDRRRAGGGPGQGQGLRPPGAGGPGGGGFAGGGGPRL